MSKRARVRLPLQIGAAEEPERHVATDPRRVAAALTSLAIGIYLMITPLSDPFLALTLKGLAIAIAIALLYSPCTRWISGACVAGSVLLVAPSMHGEESGLVGAGLAILAMTLSAASQLTKPRVDIRVRGIVLLPMLCLTAYWAFRTIEASHDEQPLIMLGYSLIFVALVIVLRGDIDAIRSSLTLLSLFVAVLGYMWVVTILAFSLLGLDPVRLSTSAYQLRVGFGYSNWGPLLITNSSGLFGLMRASQIGGEPGTWALYAALGAGSAAVAIESRRLRRFALTGCVLAIFSSQSGGALVSLLGATAAALALTALKSRSSRIGRHRVPLVILAAAAVGGLPVLLNYFISLKSTQSINSLLDRGFGYLSGGAGGPATESRISLISSLGTDGFLALFPILGLVLMLVALRRNPFAFALGVFFLIMGLFIQPVQFHFGIWYACVLVAVAAQLQRVPMVSSAPSAEARGKVRAL